MVESVYFLQFGVEPQSSYYNTLPIYRTNSNISSNTLKLQLHFEGLFFYLSVDCIWDKIIQIYLIKHSNDIILINILYIYIFSLQSIKKAKKKKL